MFPFTLIFMCYILLYTFTHLFTSLFLSFFVALFSLMCHFLICSYTFVYKKNYFYFAAFLILIVHTSFSFVPSLVVAVILTVFPIPAFFTLTTPFADTEAYDG